MKERKFEGIWMPKVLWFTHRLKPIEKFMVLEVNSLDKNEKHCYAGNNHFATLFDIGVSTVTRTLQSLEEKNLIKIVNKHTQTGTKRTVYSKLDKWLIEESANVTVTSAGESKGTSPDSQSEPLNSIKENSINKRDNKLSPAKKNSAEIIPEETFTEEEFKLGEEPEENKDPIYNWIVKVTTAARDRSIEEKASQPFSIPRNNKAKYIHKIRFYFNQLMNGSFVKLNKFDKNFLEHGLSNIDIKKMYGGREDDLMKIAEKSIDNYLTARNNPDKYDFIGRDRKIDLGTFFYEFNENNGVLGVSHFLKYLNADLKEKNDISGKEKMLSAIYEKDLSKMYSRVYNQYRDFSDEEMLRMVKSILSLCRWYKRNESRLTTIYKGKFKIRFPKGMETFIEHYLARFIEKNRYEHAISLFPDKKHWKAFADFIYEETDIDLEAEIKTEKKKDSGITITEINRRMEAD